MDTKGQHKVGTHTDPVRSHWESVYADKPPEQLSWFLPSLDTSLGLIEAAGLSTQDSVIDVGGGASTLVDSLLGRGFIDVSVLDISQAAIETSKMRLGSRADEVNWIVGDVLEFQPHRAFALWHDRACFHFMTAVEQREKYVRSLERSVVAGGACIIDTFAPDGPRRCSGLDVVRYDARGLVDALGQDWKLEKHVNEIHRTPWDSTQSFNFFLLRRA